MLSPSKAARPGSTENGAAQVRKVQSGRQITPSWSSPGREVTTEAIHTKAFIDLSTQIGISHERADKLKALYNRHRIPIMDDLFLGLVENGQHLRKD